MSNIKLLFMGTGEFAVPILQGLLRAPGVEMVAVVTQPDRPVGREQVVEGAPVKQFLSKSFADSGLQILQPEKLRLAAAEILETTTPDLIVVAAYGQMVPDAMLQYPKLGCINIHGSLLPMLRGAVPVPMAILQGLTETGVTIQQMATALDAGAILASATATILPTDTTDSLRHKLAPTALELLLGLIPRLGTLDLVPEPQVEELATYCYQSDIAKDKAEIKFATPVVVAERMVRAFYPWPIAWTMVGKRLKIYQATIASDVSFPDVTELAIRKQGKRLFLCLQDGVLELLEIQVEGKQRRVATEYLHLAA